MPLFNTTIELRKYLPINVSFDVENVMPFIKEAESKYIIPVLSALEYIKLEAAYQASVGTVPVALGAELTGMLDKTRIALANFAFMLYIPVGQVQISDEGIHIVSNDKKKTAFEHQIKKLEDKFRSAGYDGIDGMLGYLEEKKSFFTDWVASSSYTYFKESFVNTAKEFNVFVEIRESRRTFLALKPAIKKVEEFYIKPILGKTLYDQIKTEIKAGPSSVSAINKTLLEFIQPAVANLSISKSIENLMITIGYEGITVANTNNTQTVEAVQPIDKETRSALGNSFETDGLAYAEQLRQYLIEKRADYTAFTYYASSGYENSADSSVFVF